MKAFTHSLEKNADGNCQYLDDDIRCRLHKDFGIESKPAMCQLFPYTFTMTPTGAYASLSFASTGVLMNSGSPLSDQRGFLEKQLQLFSRLYPDEPDWSKIQLVDGVGLKWVDFLLIDKLLLESINPGNQKALTRQNLLNQSVLIISKLPKKMDLDNAHLTRVRPILIDQILLKLLYELYFVDDVYREGLTEFDPKQFLSLMAEQPQSLSLNFSLGTSSAKSIQFRAVNEFRLADKAGIAFDEMMTRMIFCRLFSKLYFGPGFGGLSLLSGFHHLVILTALMRIHLKLAFTSDIDASDLTWQMEQLRVLEKRLTVINLSRESHAILEVLLQSPLRIERIMSLAA